jgi:hypothetical protein
MPLWCHDAFENGIVRLSNIDFPDGTHQIGRRTRDGPRALARLGDDCIQGVSTRSVDELPSSACSCHTTGRRSRASGDSHSPSHHHRGSGSIAAEERKGRMATAPNKPADMPTAAAGAQILASHRIAGDSLDESSRSCTTKHKMSQTPACACPARHNAHCVSVRP